jgi:hypothetical protein
MKRNFNAEAQRREEMQKYPGFFTPLRLCAFALKKTLLLSRSAP